MSDPDPFVALDRGADRHRPAAPERGRRARRAAGVPPVAASASASASVGPVAEAGAATAAEGTTPGLPSPAGPPPISSDDVFGRLTGSAPTTSAPSPEPAGGEPADSPPSPASELRASRRRWVSVALLAASVVMAAISASTLWNAPSGLVAACAGLAPLLLLPGLAITAWAVHTRRHVACVLSSAAALLPWLLVAGYVTAAPAPPASDLGVRVMLVNAASGHTSAADVAATAVGRRADVLVITELTDVFAHDLAGAGLDGALVPRWIGPAEAGRSRIGVWSRYPLEQVAPVAGAGDGVLTAALVTDAGRVTMLLAHVHRAQRPGLSLHDSRPWADDLAAVSEAARAAHGPKVLLGDLDAAPWHAPYRRLVARSGLTDAADMRGRGLRPTWPSWGPFAINPLDHVMVAGGVGVRSVNADDIDGSSHRALVAEVTVPAGATR